MSVFRRDGFTCQKFGKQNDLTIDHVVPKCMGGKNALINYQTLCKKCNAEKGATIAVFSKWRRTRQYAMQFIVSYNAEITGAESVRVD